VNTEVEAAEPMAACGCVNSVPNRQVCRANCGGRESVTALGSRRRIRQRRVTFPVFPQLLHRRPRGTAAISPHSRAPGPTVSGGSAAEEVDQHASLSIGQTAERLRVSDPASGEDVAGSDRADLRHHQEDIA
jgi:hypothetical protein